MKVVFDDQIFCWQKFGGISRYFYELSKRLANAEDTSISVIAPLFVNSYLSESDSVVKGLRIPKFRNSGRIISALNSLVAPGLIRREHPDILHETYYYRRRSLAPRGCPTVVTVFDMTHEKYPHYFYKRDHTPEIKLAAVKRADRVICISANTQKDLIEITGIAPEKTKVIHLGFTLTDRTGSTSPLNEARPFLLYVGPRGGYKNFDTLLSAFSSSPILSKDYSIVAFGGGNFSSDEIEKIKSSGLKDSVRQMSGDDALLASLYKQSIAFVYPSLYEGFGIPLLEAMSFDCPVLCSNSSSLPEVAGDAACLFDPTNAEEMRTVIEKIVESVDLRNDLVRRGREHIKNFSWDRTAAQTLDVYKELQQ